jgi:hypothetical protein
LDQAINIKYRDNKNIIISMMRCDISPFEEGTGLSKEKNKYHKSSTAKTAGLSVYK